MHVALLAVAFQLQVAALPAPQAPESPPLTPPTRRAISRQRASAQATFEFARRSNLPEGFGSLGRCDVQLGRYCWWYDEFPIEAAPRAELHRAPANSTSSRRSTHSASCTPATTGSRGCACTTGSTEGRRAGRVGRHRRARVPRDDVVVPRPRRIRESSARPVPLRPSRRSPARSTRCRTTSAASGRTSPSCCPPTRVTTTRASPARRGARSRTATGSSVVRASPPAATSGAPSSTSDAAGAAREPIRDAAGGRLGPRRRGAPAPLRLAGGLEQGRADGLRRSRAERDRPRSFAELQFRARRSALRHLGVGAERRVGHEDPHRRVSLRAADA